MCPIGGKYTLSTFSRNTTKANTHGDRYVNQRPPFSRWTFQR